MAWYHHAMHRALTRGAAPASLGGAAWHLDPAIALLLGTAVAVYGLSYRAAHRAGQRVPPRWQALAYLAGIATLALALLGPPDRLAAVLFSAHMVQHVLLTLVAPPLIVLGRPVQVVLRGLRPRYGRALLRQTVGRRWVRRGLTVLAHPVTIVLLANGSLVFWHLPGPYQAAVRSPAVHALEHACLLGTALLFWWVLVEPVPRHHRLSPAGALLALFASWMVSDLLGATLTLARTPFYPVYVEAGPPWSGSPLADQRLGGLIMWIGGGAFYGAVILGILVYPYVRCRLEQCSLRRAP